MRNIWALVSGFLIGTLGGLIGLGGAEFRLPLLLSVFKFRVTHAIVLNLIVSLVTVLFSLLFRTGLGRLYLLVEYFPIVLNLLGGSLVGSYFGAQLVSRLPERTLRQWIGGALIFLSLILMSHDLLFQNVGLDLNPWLRIALGLLAGFVIGVFSSALGIAGGELIIPTITLLFGVDIKLAGTLSLAISIPTLMVGLSRYYRRQGFGQLRPNFQFIVWMSLGSIAGALTGSYLLQYVSSSFVVLFLGGILLLSAVRLLTEQETPAPPLLESK